jgi:hypothetical protein
MPMRSELVENYFNEVKAATSGKQGVNDVFREIYKQVMDTRIFNNLK